MYLSVTLGLLPPLITVNNAMNISLLKTLWGCIPSCRIAVSFSNSNFFRNHHTIFHSDYTTLYSYQQ